MRPRATPIGLQLARTSKTVGRAFNEALAGAGGSLPVWLILSTLRGRAHASQHDLARGIGIEGPTLTRHLDQLEAAGLVRRVPHPDDRRAVLVEPTDAGVELHARLLEVVIAFNRSLTSGLSQDELEALRRALGVLEANVRPSGR
ncbi:MAG TPA: MarR family transcriptional regulator [Gaiella sp.]|jgi:MarR family transcriptional regulator for hemolysin|nr:MarR family transcriptional regulator [Gaiella sp.]